MRVSNDAGPSWSEGSQGNMLQETIASHYFNNVFWQNDPDCVVLRDERTHLLAHEVEALGLWSGILGGTVTTSDVLHRLPPGRLALWRFLEPGEKGGATLPFWEEERRLKVAVRRYAEGEAWAALFLNPAAGAVTDRVDVASLVGQREAFAWEWGPERAQPLGKRSDLVVETVGHASRLYYLSLSDAPPPAGLTLGGKRT